MANTKRFAIFAGYNHYPSGGWQDFQESFDTLDEAHAYIVNKNSPRSEEDWRGEWDFDWCHIVDLTTRQIVSRPDL